MRSQVGPRSSNVTAKRSVQRLVWAEWKCGFRLPDKRFRERWYRSAARYLTQLISLCRPRLARKDLRKRIDDWRGAMYFTDQLINWMVKLSW